MDVLEHVAALLQEAETLFGATRDDSLSATPDWDGLFGLFTPSASAEERTEYLQYAKRQGFHPLAGLKLAEEVVSRFLSGFDLFGKLLPALIAVVRDAPRLFPSQIPLLVKQSSGSVSLSQDQVFVLLVLSFFSRLPHGPGSTFGKVSWLDLVGRSNPVGVHRIACLLCYFHRYLFDPINPACSTSDGAAFGTCRALLTDSNEVLPSSKEPSMIRFERICFNPEQLPDLDSSLQPLLETPKDITISSAVRIEDFTSSDAVVDFANKFVHIGCVIPSATQEEVLFSIYPECMLAVVLFEELDDNEVGCIHGVRRYSNYTGYGPRFQFDGAHVDGTDQRRTQSVVIMDALENGAEQQFTHFGYHRDVYKALCGFESVRLLGPQGRSSPTVVATGGWGCGVFRGDQTLKFLQQVAAAALAGVRLDYSTFGHTDRQASLEAIAFRLATRHVTVQDLSDWVHSYHTEKKGGGGGDDENAKDFELFILEKLR